jgi:hypothetical protein
MHKYTEGYYIIALGEKYFEEAKNYLLYSIKKFDKDRRVCVEVLKEDELLFKRLAEMGYISYTTGEQNTLEFKLGE